MSNDASTYRSRAQQVSWSWSCPDSRELTMEILNEAATRFENATVVPRRDEEVVDLRAEWEGRPVRFSVWMKFHAIEMTIKETGHTLELHRDLDQVPKGKIADDPWDADEDRRVFVGEGIFVQGDDDEVKESLVAWGRLKRETQDQLLAAMADLNVSVVQLFDEDIMLCSESDLMEEDDPGEYLQNLAEMMLLLKELAKKKNRLRDDDQFDDDSAEETVAGIGRAGSWVQMTCDYCGSFFFLTVGKHACPNCGGTAKASTNS